MTRLDLHHSTTTTTLEDEIAATRREVAGSIVGKNGNGRSWGLRSLSSSMSYSTRPSRPSGLSRCWVWAAMVRACSGVTESRGGVRAKSRSSLPRAAIRSDKFTGRR